MTRKSFLAMLADSEMLMSVTVCLLFKLKFKWVANNILNRHFMTPSECAQNYFNIKNTRRKIYNWSCLNVLSGEESLAPHFLVGITEIKQQEIKGSDPASNVPTIW